MAERLNEPADVKAEAEALRALLNQELDSDVAGSLVYAYKTVALRLNEQVDEKTAATTLRQLLEKERDVWNARILAQAYATVAGAIFKHADAQGSSSLVQAILTLAGHPFVADPTPLLGALKPLAGEDFGRDVGAAVRWAEKTYGIKPAQLRPPPLPAEPPRQELPSRISALFR